MDNADKNQSQEKSSNISEMKLLTTGSYFITLAQFLNGLVLLITAVWTLYTFALDRQGDSEAQRQEVVTQQLVKQMQQAIVERQINTSTGKKEKKK